MKFEFKPLTTTQSKVFYYGRQVAVCGNEPGAFAYFLFDAPLTDDEKRDVMRGVTEKFGRPKSLKQIRDFLPDDDEREVADD